MSGRDGIFLACDTLPENPWSRDRLPAIRAALAGRRHEIVDIYDFGSEEQAHRLHRARGRGFFDPARLESLNRSLVERALNSNCRIVIFGTVDNYAHFLLPATVRRLQEAGCLVVGILGDDEFNFPHNWPQVFLMDRTIAYVRAAVDAYNALRPGSCLHFPSSCHFDGTDFEALQVREEDKLHNVALFGSVFPARLRVVSALAAAGLPLDLFGGRGWSRIRPLARHYRGFVRSADFDLTVRRSRVVLALLEDHLTGDAHMNTKIWEAVRNGQFCIATQYPPLVDDYGLEEGRDIVVYDSLRDLVEKTRHYLAHPEERREIAERLFRKIRERFAYETLYAGLFDALEGIRGGDGACVGPEVVPTVTLLGEADPENAAGGFPVWRFPLRGRWRRAVAELWPERVRTSHVILARPGYRYDRCLHALAGAMDGERDVVRLRCGGAAGADSATLLWRADAFRRRVLRGGGLRALVSGAALVAFASAIPVDREAGPSARAWWDSGVETLVRAGRWARTRIEARHAGSRRVRWSRR
jgi:hypothetical protein